MNSPHEHEHEHEQAHDQKNEERALEALMVAALRKQDLDGMTFEKLLAFENDLTPEDREAIDALALDKAGLDLIDRVLSIQRSTGESVRPTRRDGVSEVGRRKWTHSTNGHSPSKGAKIMKSLVISLLVISGLTGAIVVGTRGGPAGNGGPAGSTAFDQDTVDLLMNRLESIEQRLGNLNQLENRLDRLASQVATAATASRDASVAYGSRTTEERAKPVEGERNDDDLRDYIVRIMDDVQEEKLADRRRQVEERQRELMALHEGPYEGHNYRVNTMAKRLDLSDRQKQHYYVNLVEYNQMIEQSRENESQDKDNRQQYRDERKRIRSEFSQVVMSALSPEQAETFSSLPSREQRPDGSMRYVTTSSLRLASGMIPPAGEPVFNVITREAPVTGFFDFAGTMQSVRAFAEQVAVQKSLTEARRALEEVRAAEIEAQKRATEAKASKAAQEAQSDK